jgi:hypothetical protein
VAPAAILLLKLVITPLLGLFAFVAFFLALAELLVGQGIAVAFIAAIVVALASQGATIAFGRRQRIA